MIWGKGRWIVVRGWFSHHASLRSEDAAVRVFLLTARGASLFESNLACDDLTRLHRSGGDEARPADRRRWAARPAQSQQLDLGTRHELQAAHPGVRSDPNVRSASAESPVDWLIVTGRETHRGTLQCKNTWQHYEALWDRCTGERKERFRNKSCINSALWCVF